MGNWGEDVDYEAKLIKDHEGRFTMNFKKIYMDVDEISEKTLEVTDKHPKDSLLKLWAGTMLGFFLFFVLSYQYLTFVMLPFMAFYLIALIRVAKCWKSFNYNTTTFWLMSVVSLGGLFALSRGVQLLLEMII